MPDVLIRGEDFVEFLGKLYLRIDGIVDTKNKDEKILVIEDLNTRWPHKTLNLHYIEVGGVGDDV